MLYAFMCRGVGVYGPRQNFCFEIHLAQIQLFIKLQCAVLFLQNAILSQPVTMQGKVLKI